MHNFLQLQSENTKSDCNTFAQAFKIMCEYDMEGAAAAHQG